MRKTLEFSIVFSLVTLFKFMVDVLFALCYTDSVEISFFMSIFLEKGSK